uniref:Uncharacterized protein n=1 Tax=Cannabis sativa TaxID=3483 RepID=A0A803QB40_CANSA
MVEIRETQLAPTNVLRRYNVDPTKFLVDMHVMTQALGFNMPMMPLIPPILPFQSLGAGSSSQTAHLGDDDEDDVVVDL